MTAHTPISVRWVPTHLAAAATVVLTLSLLVAPATASDLPVIERSVNDPAGVLTDAEEASIAARLQEIRDETGVQIAVLVVKSVGEQTIEAFSLQVAIAWAGGSRTRDDGLLLTVAIADRKMRLEQGTGTLEWITEAEAQVIVDSMIPAFKEARYADGLQEALEGIGAELHAAGVKPE